MSDSDRQEQLGGGFEARLAAWKPATALDRDRLLFEAGAAAGRRSMARGLGAAAGLVLLIGFAAGSLVLRERGRSLARLVAANEAMRGELERHRRTADRVPARPEPGPPDPSSYLMLTRGLGVREPSGAFPDPVDVPFDQSAVTPLSARNPAVLIEL